MFGIRVVVLAMLPFLAGVWCGLTQTKTSTDQWLMIGVGFIGSMCVLANAYDSHCVEKEDGEGG